MGAPGGLRLADESILYENLGVRQGCVTGFAVINDTNKNVKLLLDSELVEGSHDRVFFHPLSNAASTGVGPKDFLRFAEATGHTPVLVKFWLLALTTKLNTLDNFYGYMFEF